MNTETSNPSVDITLRNIVSFCGKFPGYHRLSRTQKYAFQRLLLTLAFSYFEDWMYRQKDKKFKKYPVYQTGKREAGALYQKLKEIKSYKADTGTLKIFYYKGSKYIRKIECAGPFADDLEKRIRAQIPMKVLVLKDLKLKDASLPIRIPKHIRTVLLGQTREHKLLG